MTREFNATYSNLYWSEVYNLKHRTVDSFDNVCAVEHHLIFEHGGRIGNDWLIDHLVALREGRFDIEIIPETDEDYARGFRVRLVPKEEHV